MSSHCGVWAGRRGGRGPGSCWRAESDGVGIAGGRGFVHRPVELPRVWVCEDRVSCACHGAIVRAYTGTPLSGLACRFLVCCFLGSGGYAWKSGIFSVQVVGSRMYRRTASALYLYVAHACRHESGSLVRRCERQRRGWGVLWEGAVRLGVATARRYRPGVPTACDESVRIAEGHRAGKGRVRMQRRRGVRGMLLGQG